MIQLSLDDMYQRVRSKTESLCQGLNTEDYVIQSAVDVSPPKWHLAHTTWFFETFILLPFFPTYQPFDETYQYLFNSYYQTIGFPYPREKRGLLSRPTVSTIYQYRQSVDEAMLVCLRNTTKEMRALIQLGIEHEQQHQELLLMDIKHNFSIDPSFITYQHKTSSQDQPLIENESIALELLPMQGGLFELGYEEGDFCFDNELPLHHYLLKPFMIANRLVTNEEYLEFVLAGGYQTPIYWSADGFDCVQKNNWQAPLYWQNIYDEWFIYTLNGLIPLNVAEPVAHLSYYEADAYARFCNKRLPSEMEWEYVAKQCIGSKEKGNFLERSYLHPERAALSVIQNEPLQLFGDLWEWTSSAYSPYPGYRLPQGAMAEYNGKFMTNQFVLRGGSCVTPIHHIRPSYRNFYQPDKRWQFSGVRLACDLGD